MVPRQVGAAVAIAIVLLLVGAQGANATTRFAAPGGTGTAPCMEQTNPCTLFKAADPRAGVVQPNDEVVLSPGTYSDSDLSSTFNVEGAGGLDIHGELDKPRPLITSGISHGLINLTDGGTISHLELQNTGIGSAFLVRGGVVDDVIASASGSGTCSLQSTPQHSGLIRDSVCLSSGSGGLALVVSGFGDGASAFAPKLRNVTAIASGASSTGLVFIYTDAIATVSAKSVITEGAQDIKAVAIDAGASTSVELENSDYDSVTVDGSLGASSPKVTPSGTNGNIEAPPLLAADGFHELPGSPTVDAGLLDTESGISDIDGQLRTLGMAADIGADELTSSSATGVSCSPDSLTESGAASTCTATVIDPSASGPRPRGTVSFQASGPGAFSSGAVCTLPENLTGQASCQVTYVPQAASGEHAILASYAGDLAHEPSQGTTSVFALSPEPEPSQETTSVFAVSPEPEPSQGTTSVFALSPEPK